MPPLARAARAGGGARIADPRAREAAQIVVKTSMANTESSDLLQQASSSVAALTRTAHDLVGMLLRAEQQPEADGSLASLTRTVQAGSEAHWAVVARAAASLDAVAAESGDASGEVALLQQQRRELHEVAAPSLRLPAPWLARPAPQPAVFACTQPAPPSPSRRCWLRRGPSRSRSTSCAD